MTYLPPLVTTEWLAKHIDDSNLRILDATVLFTVRGNGPIAVSSGRENYEKAHIPGAQFADLLSELSDTASELSFALPSEGQFAHAMGRLGVTNDSNIVVYSTGHTGWATRLWWLLTAFSHDQVAVLDGGLDKWQREKRLLSSGVEPVTETAFNAKLNRESVALRESVYAAVTESSTSHCVVDSLPAAYFNGTAGDTYGYARLGHITGAVNVPTDDMINPDTGEFLPSDMLREKFSEVLNAPKRKLITYCGGGIAATQNAFVLHLLGCRNVAVYDGSLQEWSKDESLPMSLN